MKVLIDSCVAAAVAAALRQAGHDVEAAQEWAADPGDEAILQHAIRNAQLLVTIDKDFGELVIVRGLRHSGLIRLVGFRASAQAAAILTILDLYGSELEQGAVLTVEPWLVRVRSP